MLDENRRGSYTVPAEGLYPYQWCWDSGPIALGWAALDDWDQAWGELTTLLSAQWSSGFVPHIVFWQESDDYFPGPEVWGTAGRAPATGPPTTGLTQPPLPVSAATRLYAADPDRRRARERLRELWPKLVAWLVVGRSGPARPARRRGGRASMGVGNGQLTGVGRAARRDAGDVEPPPRAARRADGVGEAAPEHEGVPALSRDRRRTPRRRVGHRAPGGRQPVRGRGRGLHRHRGARSRRSRRRRGRPRRGRDRAGADRDRPAGRACRSVGRRHGLVPCIRREGGPRDRASDRGRSRRRCGRVSTTCACAACWNERTRGPPPCRSACRRPHPTRPPSTRSATGAARCGCS